MLECRQSIEHTRWLSRHKRRQKLSTVSAENIRLLKFSAFQNLNLKLKFSHQGHNSMTAEVSASASAE